MAEIVSTLMPPKWSASFPSFQERFEKRKDDPELKKLLKKAWATAQATLLAQIYNGATRDGDSVLRYFLSDTCNRIWNLGPWDSLPGSFNVTSDFFRHLPVINSYELVDESDHEFSLSEFLDFVTSPGRSPTEFEIPRFVAEGKIYHYTNVAPLDEVTAGDSRTQRFVLASCSLIRHESELSTCVVAGQPIEESKPVLEAQAKGELTITKGKEALADIKTDEQREAVQLRKNPKWWKIVLLMRTDFDRNATQARYLLRDCGDQFDVITDDPATFFDSRGEPIADNWEERLRYGATKLGEFAPLFELASYCSHLPHYFSLNGANIRSKAVRTDFGKMQSSLKFAKRVAASRASARVPVRTIHEVLRKVGTSPDLTIAPASLRIERSGFWKKLKKDECGVDRDGQVARGKTWVTKELSWIEPAKAPDEFRIEKNMQVDGPDPGHLYVLRNAAHANDVFKIGLTRRQVEVRANELGSHTGVPDDFLIVQRWNVGNCARVEALVHEQLDACRLTSNREFFKAPYELIREAVDQVLKIELP